MLTQDQILTIMTYAIGNQQPIKTSDSIDSVDEWDSLTHLNLLTELDKALDGKLSDIEELGQQTTVEGILSILKANKLIS